MVHERYGPPEVLHLQDMPRPEPGDHDVLVRVHATTVTSGDVRVRSQRVPTGFGLVSRLVFGVTRPRQPILGTEFSGDVVAVGPQVRRFRIGDAVFGFRGARMGCHAEYLCMPEDGMVVPKPSTLSHQEAAALSFGGTTALDFLRKGRVGKGDRILVNGASGGVGTAAVQLARYFGAEVTGVCSAANVAMVRALGAAHVIDYTQQDFTCSGETYHLIMDTAGTAPYARSKAALTRDGRLLLVLAGLPDMLPIPWVALSSRRRIVAGPAAERAEDLRFLAELAEAGAFRPVVDRCFTFEEMVQAHQYVDSGHKKGNVVVTLLPDG